ncbi:hypothetical protein RM553_01420 [Zunongwangia sp. F363]|uniref:Lipoprotein n=1 Tax=Autumnicola tepida TaxID=3075595 RepID=A0ABU3C570_9FLAO|nr:hypothetical protein [Zunongwangia sp. F363]MDT0641479.1 hypothetical protein [Zunongwangia sp. F363]
MKKLLLLTGLIFLFSACDSNSNCEDYSCFTPPEAFEFEFIDATSGENLFTNGTFQEEDISITDQSEDSDVDVVFISENDYNILQVGSIGWETENTDYLIEIGEEVSFRLLVDADRVTEDCCSFTRINSVEIEGAEYERQEETGVYQILVE